MAPARHVSHSPVAAHRARPRASGTAVEPDEKKLRKVPPGTTPDKPGAGRNTPLGRKVESPASLKTAGPSGQRTRTLEQKKHTNK